MIIEVKAPSPGESISEVEIASWLVQDGDYVYKDQELAEIEKDLERDTRRLQEYIAELRQLGVEPKGPDGLVDFPSMMDGRVVYLCWKLGEPEILFWHEVEEGFAGRQPLTAESVSGGGQREDDSLS